MLARNDLRTGFRPSVRPSIRPFVHRPRSAGDASAATIAAEAGEPAAFPLAVGSRRAAAEPIPVPLPATAMLAPTGEARLLRRLRHVVRRRVRIELDGLVRASVRDSEIDLDVRADTSADRRIVEWSADRPVALVVLHDGCGARVIGSGGLIGRVELPSVTCARAFLAFCYDSEAGLTVSPSAP